MTVVALGLGAVKPTPVITVNGPQAPEEFNPKRLIYEVSGSVGSGGMLVYVDIDGHPHLPIATQVVDGRRPLMAFSIPAAFFTVGCFYIFGSLEHLHVAQPSE